MIQQENLELEMLQLVASELINAGFKVKNCSDVLEVSLTSRRLYQQEVETALDQIFEDIDFTFLTTTDKILVTL